MSWLRAYDNGGKPVQEAQAIYESSRNQTILILIIVGLLPFAVASFLAEDIVGGARVLAKVANKVAVGEVEQSVGSALEFINRPQRHGVNDRWVAGNSLALSKAGPHSAVFQCSDTRGDPHPNPLPLRRARGLAARLLTL